MIEGGITKKLDRYFRRTDTVLAGALKVISPHRGERYRMSNRKALLEGVVASAVLIPLVPVIAASAVAIKAEDGGKILYRQKRVARGGPVDLIKFRSMPEGSDKESWAVTHRRNSTGDPNELATPVGKFLRKSDLDEAPQLFQVVTGELSLFGVRAAVPGVFDEQRKHLTPKQRTRFLKVYMEGKPALLSLNAALSPNRKDDTKRHRFDNVYENATLGTDLYGYWRMALRLLSRSTGSTKRTSEPQFFSARKLQEARH